MRSLALLLSLLFSVSALASTATLTWIAPTTNTDGSAITATLTYNVYQGPEGALVKVQSALTALSVSITTGLTAGTTQCFTVSAIENGVESGQSLPACVTLAPLSATPPAIHTVTIS